MSDTPDWFWAAVEDTPDAKSIEVEDCDINYLTWSDSGTPGLLFVHGHNAHAHWWDFIAPAFKQNHQTVALDMSGMGDSDHRDAYSNDTYVKEIIAVADDANLPKDSILIAHSFGGMQAIRTMAQHPDRFKGLILVDSGVRHPDDIKEREPQLERLGRAKVYPEREIAIARFRLQPPQTCDNQYVVDYIARNSVEYDEGWTWKFDEELNSRVTLNGDLESDLKAIEGKLALIYGENSESFKATSAAFMKELMPNMTVVEIKDAQHHLFLDQPLAFIEEVKSVLADWA
ncbi:MAG: pimeloyl-ACP methyl ester carboxylesterase [Candidatus Azotimanducaceae bacterium]|jgi:pimeloyl-ACP methyl ester carboxylesterase